MLRSRCRVFVLIVAGAVAIACSSDEQADNPSEHGDAGAGSMLPNAGRGSAGNGDATAGAGDELTGGVGGSAGAGAAGENGNLGGSPASGGGTANGGTNTAVGGQATAGAAGSTTGTTACSNGKDDDGDGAIDGFDAECTGYSDNDEGTYATGIPGDNRDPKWQDCFFDGNSGAGDDHCRYATGCLTDELEATHTDCQLTKECVDFCKPLTPNGCDCFGCCTVQLENGTTLDVTLSATCSLGDASDAEACARCTKTTQCTNDCGECELCAGKTVEDLPASCTPPPVGEPPDGEPPGGEPPDGEPPDGEPPDGEPPDGEPPVSPPSYTCDNGETVCSDQLLCEPWEYCSFGCCLPQIR